MSGLTIAMTVISMTFIWTIVYFITCLSFPHKRSVWHSLVVVLIHGCVSSVLAYLYQVSVDPRPMTNHPKESDTDGQILTMSVTMGFFIFEFGWYLTHPGNKTIALWIHHVVTIVALVDPLYFGQAGDIACTNIFWSEVTIPPMILRWFMRDSGTWHPLYVLSMEYLFLVSYAFIRVVLGSVYLYGVLLHSSVRYTSRLGCLGFYVVGFMILKDSTMSCIRHTRRALGMDKKKK